MLFKILTVTMLVQIELAFSNTSLPIIHTRIVQGLKAKLGQFPWHAHLHVRKDNGGAFVCGGSLITNEWVLTAAHCVVGSTRISVGLGIINTVTHEHVGLGKRYIAHHDYKSKYLYNDIGLIQLSKLAPITRLIQTVALPSKNIEKDIVPGLIGTVCGFGKSSDLDNSKPIKLLWFTTQILPIKMCKDRFNPSYITDNTICADGINSNQNICNGDSGGGLVVEIKGTKYIVGVVSFGRSVKCAGAPAGYQKVIPHLSWIKEIIKK